MIVLALDTAGADCAACLYDSDSATVLASVTENIGRGHAERLMGMVSDVLEQSSVKISQVQRVSVVIGPGSFTGIRVSVAAARGFALVPGVDAVGVTTLDVLAAQHVEQRDNRAPFMVAMDAKRDEVYWGEYDAGGIPSAPPCILSVEDAKRIMAVRPADTVVIGSAAAIIAGEGEGGEADRFPIAIVAQLGAAISSGAPRPKPLYLRGPDVKPQDGYALARK